MCVYVFVFFCSEPIPMYSKVSETVKVSPKYAGKRKIIAAFHSRQLVGITGSVDLNVLKA